MRQIEHPEILHGRIQFQIPLSAREVNLRPDLCGLSIGASIGQGGVGVGFNGLVVWVPFEQPDLIEGLSTIVAPHTEHPIFGGDAGAVCCGLRKPSSIFPVPLPVLFNQDMASISDGSPTARIPVSVEINGVPSVVEMEWTSGGASLLGHRIPIDRQLQSGWGSVSIPGDENALDNQYYFAFAQPPAPTAVVVTDRPEAGASFQLGLSIPSFSNQDHAITVLAPEQAGEIDWDNTALLVWQAALPQGVVAEEIERFVQSGKRVMSFVQ